MKSKLKLSEIGEFKNGLNFNRNDYGVGYPIINVKQLYQSRFATTENLLGIKSDFSKKIDGYFVEKGDLLFVRGSMVPEGAGKLVMVNEFKKNTVFSGFIIRFRITHFNIANSLFLTYLLRSPEYREIFVRIASGSVHSNMNQEILGNIEVQLPNISKQNQIIEILDTIDTHIESLQYQNKILEKIEEVIFKSWFIDFDGVTEFEDSEFGQIPKGWETTTIGKVIELVYGKALTKKNRKSGLIPVYGSSGIVGYHNESLSDGPGIIVGRKGNVGSVYWSSSSFCAIDTAYYVKTKLSFPYVYQNFKNQNFIDSDSTVPGLQRNQAYSLSILIPETSILKKFESISHKIRFLLEFNLQKINSLSDIRDLILPKLMSGEIRV